MPLNWYRGGLGVGRGRTGTKHHLRRETGGILQEVMREKLIYNVVREEEREEEREK